MYSHFELLLTLRCTPSCAIAGLLVAAYAGAVAAVILAAIPAWLTACVVAALACGCGASLLHFRSMRRQPPRQLILAAGDRWLLQMPGAEVEELKPVPPAFVHPWLVVLQFASGGGKRHAFLFTPDNCDADLLRRVRVRLRFPVNGRGAGGVNPIS